MTKTSVFLEDVKEGKAKPIEFTKRINYDTGELAHPNTLPVQWDNVTLMFSPSSYDIMFAWNDGNVDGGCLYKGHWNDGVVK